MRFFRLPFFTARVAAAEAAAADAEARLAASNDLLRAAADAVAATCLLLEADDRLRVLSDGAQLFSNSQPPQSGDELIAQLGGTADVKESFHIAAAIADRSSDLAEESLEEPVFAVPTEDGGVRWLALGARWVGDGGRLFVGLRDVTQDRKRIDWLERRLALVSRSLDRAPFGLAVLGGDGLIRETNTAFVALAGGKPLSQAPFQDLFVAEERDRIAAFLSDIAKSSRDTSARGALDLHLAGGGAAGRIVTIHASRTVLPDSEQSGILIHAIDATERKRLETQFAQSQKMQAVGQLAGGIAHDFNNVLTAIIGFCDLLLQRHQPGDPSFADVMQIQQNANRAAGLTRQLLAFSRQQTIRSRIFDITDTLAELSNLLRRLLGESAELSVIHGRDLWTVRGDRGQLEQVIINLAVNARDAMPNGGRLTIQTDNFTSDRPYELRDDIMPAGDYVMISVADTGIGIEKEVLDRLFEPFFTTKEVGQGTGLGLAMVYGSVSQMDGYVIAHSDGKGKGAAFSLYLPRAVATDKDLARAAYFQGRETEAIDDTGGERILLVEDEDAVRLFSARALRSKGYDVTEARTGEVALEILSDQSFDLLVTDMVMPKVDGATLIKEARKANPTLPVICISGYTREAVAREVGELPQVSFLSKPFSLKQLTARVRASLESVRAKTP